MKQVIVAALAALLWNGARAAGSFVQVTPSLVEIALVPGKSYSGILSVCNTKSERFTVQVEVSEGWVTETGRPGLPTERWLTLRVPATFTLNPGQTRRIRYRAKAPKDFVGETLAHVFFSFPAEGVPSQALNVQLRHGIPIYLAAKGTQSVTLSVPETLVQRPAGAAPAFIFTLASEGNVHVRPRGTVEVTGADGTLFESIPLDYGDPLFPGGRQKYFARSRTLVWPAGRYQVRLAIAPLGFGSAPEGMERVFGLSVEGDGFRLREETLAP